MDPVPLDPVPVEPVPVEPVPVEPEKPGLEPFEWVLPGGAAMVTRGTGSSGAVVGDAVGVILGIGGAEVAVGAEVPGSGARGTNCW